MDRARGPATGLNRTGKSCRLRWVNYLHPGLKRGRMSPQEQRLVLHLHSQWGNRWSRIARRLPGRTDNEIKNYWRTHMRKKAQEKKRNTTWSSSSPSQSPSSSTSLSYVSPSPTEPLLDQTGGGCSSQGLGDQEGLGYSMDQIWNEIATPEAGRDEACRIACPPMPSPDLWEDSSESLWKLDEEELKMFPSMGGFEVSNYHHGREPCY